MDGGRFGLDRFGLEDPPEFSFDLGHRQPADVVALQSGQDRRREFLGVGRGEHEGDELGWFFERLEEGVPGVPCDLVRLVEDVDLSPQVGRRVVDPLAKLPDIADPSVGCRVDLDQIERPALADGDARGAGVAWVPVTQVGAVERLGEDPGE